MDWKEQTFKVANRKEIEVFRERWFSEPQFVETLQRLRADYHDAPEGMRHFDIFERENQAERDAVSNAPLSKWVSQTHKNMFHKHYEIAPASAIRLPTYFCEQRALDLVDLRGFPNDIDACWLFGAYLKDVDLSYTTAGFAAASSIPPLTAVYA